ncbi:MAG: DUF1819 family protein [Bacteroidales bacterium]|nr:DUF1819 family protein [Bacteroidales bacterium]
MPDSQGKYLFSFTAASMRLSDSLKIAQNILDNPEMLNHPDRDKILGYGKSRTNEREYRELMKRIDKFTPSQLRLYVSSDIITQRHLLYLSICKTYGFIRDFVIEVLREKALVFDYNIHDGDYQSFVNRKRAIHLELENLADSTLKKIRQVTFLILEEAGLINNSQDRVLQLPLLSDQLISEIKKDDTIWLKVFLWADKDIERIKNG